MNWTPAMSLTASLLLGLTTLPAASRSLNVSAAGNDGNDGSADAPFASLERARQAIRALKAGQGLPVGGVTVIIHGCSGGGTLTRDTTFLLEEEDSGTAESPITYRNCSCIGEGGVETRLTGAVRLPAAAFRPLEDPEILARLPENARNEVLRADLSAFGIESVKEYPIRFRGAAKVPEVFFNNQRMEVARWPNDGWATVDRVIERGARPRDRGATVAVGGKPTTPGEEQDWDRPGTIQVQGNRPSRWNVERGVWLNGYWCYDWYDEALKVREIDVEQGRITFEIAHRYGIGGGNPGPRRFYAFNLLEELDRPGEYYLDPTDRVLYFWPPAPLSEDGVLLSTLAGPIIQLQDVSHLILHGLTLEACQGTGLTVSGGRKVTVRACTVRNTGTVGINVNGGREHLIEACDIHDTGTLGLVLNGGDRPTLTPAEHLARNNHIYRFGRRQRTYASGIQLRGVGNRLAHNLLHDAPHQAIGMSGNDHLVEFNEIHHVIMETDDCGALYTGRNPSNRGSIIRYNFWHHLGTPLGHGNAAIYFDDGDGGQTVFGNIFFRTGEPSSSRFAAVYNNGGHGNLVDNNIFIECRRALGASRWSDERWARMLEGELWQTRLREQVDITKPPFTERYPELVGFFEPEGKPRVNRAQRNVVALCGAFMVGNYVTENNWFTDEDPGFVDAAAGNFALREEAPVFEHIPDFEAIPFERIGLLRDAWRPRLPERGWPYDPPTQAPPPDTRASRSAAVAKTSPPPEFTVPRTRSAIRIDGAIHAEEWGGADPKNAMLLAQDLRGTSARPVSRAWLFHDGEALLVAVDNAVDAAVPLSIGRGWGRNEAVEIAISNPAQGDAAPIVVLRGYADGYVESSAEAGAPAAVVARADQGVTYDAKVMTPSRWTAEWRIPFASLGVDPAKNTRLAFNITVYKPGSDLWLMWEGTHGNSWHLDQAGILELAP